MFYFWGKDSEMDLDVEMVLCNLLSYINVTLTEPFHLLPQQRKAVSITGTSIYIQHNLFESNIVTLPIKFYRFSLVLY